MFSIVIPPVTFVGKRLSRLEALPGWLERRHSGPVGHAARRLPKIVLRDGRVHDARMAFPWNLTLSLLRQHRYAKSPFLLRRRVTVCRENAVRVG